MLAIRRLSPARASSERARAPPGLRCRRAKPTWAGRACRRCVCSTTAAGASLMTGAPGRSATSATLRTRWTAAAPRLCPTPSAACPAQRRHTASSARPRPWTPTMVTPSAPAALLRCRMTPPPRCADARGQTRTPLAVPAPMRCAVYAAHRVPGSARLVSDGVRISLQPRPTLLTRVSACWGRAQRWSAALQAPEAAAAPCAALANPCQFHTDPGRRLRVRSVLPSARRARPPS